MKNVTSELGVCLQKTLFKLIAVQTNRMMIKTSAVYIECIGNT